MFAAWFHDIRHALRVLSRQRLFSVLAITGLGIGLGLNMAIHSLFHQAVLKPLPASAPQQLVNLVASGPKNGSTSTNRAGAREAIFSYPMARDLQRAAADSETFTGLAAHRAFPTNIALGENTISGSGMLVSGNYFDVLGLRPALGRLLQAQDDTAAGAGRVAVLAWDYWRNALGGDPGVLDRDLRVNGESLRIVGVAPQGFAGTTFGVAPQVFVPISLRWLLQPGMPKDEDNRRSWWVYLFGRLAPGIAPAQARDALNLTYAALLRDVELPLQQGLDDATKAGFLGGRIALEAGARGQSNSAREMRTPLLLLQAAAGLVLLITCLNLANLLVARGIGRASELALRVSIGASRARIARQLLAESLVLAFGGLLLAVPVADLAMRALVAVLPSGEMFAGALALRPATFAFAAVLTLAALLLSGALPAFNAASLSPAPALRGDSTQATSSRGAVRLRGGLVILQTALSMATLAMAGLFAQSLYHLEHESLGVRAESIAGLSIFPGRSGYTTAQTNQLLDELGRRLATLPGVEAGSFSRVPLFSNDIWQSSVRVEGVASQPDGESPLYNAVDEGYFATLGVPLLAGRAFNEADAAGASRVAVVSRGFARRFGLEGDVLGRRISFSDDGPLDIEIVGIVADSKVSGVRADEPAQVYVPRRQEKRISDGSWYLRTRGDPAALLPAMRAAVAALDPQLPVHDLRTLPQTIARNLAVERFVGALAAAFAVLATALAALGLFGVVSYTLSRRRRELGLRLALGAAPLRLVRMLLAQVGRLGAVGVLLGIGLAVACGRLAQSLLFGVHGGDPLTLLLAVVALVAVGAAATAMPALRVRHMDPAAALRDE